LIADVMAVDVAGIILDDPSKITLDISIA
jgi:hypothetical protein